MIRRTSLATLLFTLITFVVVGTINPQPISAETSLRIYAVHVNRGINNTTITWQTTPATIGRIEYAGANGNWLKTPWSDNFAEEHSLTILSLNANTTYLFRINAEDKSGNLFTQTDSFTTLDEKVLGISTDTSTFTSDDGFGQLLSPTPTLVTPTPTINLNFPTVLGQQSLQAIYPYPLPYPYAYQPQPTVETTPEPSPTPTPTIAPTGIAGVTQNTIYLTLGLLLGVSVAILIHLLQKLPTTTNNGKSTDTASNSSNHKPLGKQFHFTVDRE